MANAAIRIRFGGYAPADSVHTQAARAFKEAVEREAGGDVVVDVFHNVLDFGYGFGDLLEMVRAGVLTCGYASTAYLAEAAPALGAFDLPFLFPDRGAAHAAMDGALGDLLAREAEAGLGLACLGYWENGFRHVTSRRGPVASLGDLAGLRIRIQPNAIHRRTFELLGAAPVPTDLKDLLPAIAEGRVDAHENPLENIHAYGIHHHHPFVSLTGHFYGVRGLYANAATLRGYPQDVRDLVRRAGRAASMHQRRLAAEKDARMAGVLRAEGVELHQPDAAFLEACRRRVAPILEGAAAWVGPQAAAAIARLV
jgi:TRAP-type C4-dicarboxylate transport system substrate-binding protein